MESVSIRGIPGPSSVMLISVCSAPFVVSMITSGASPVCSTAFLSTSCRTNRAILGSVVISPVAPSDRTVARGNCSRSGETVSLTTASISTGSTLLLRSNILSNSIAFSLTDSRSFAFSSSVAPTADRSSVSSSCSRLPRPRTTFISLRTLCRRTRFRTWRRCCRLTSDVMSWITTVRPIVPPRQFVTCDFVARYVRPRSWNRVGRSASVLAAILSRTVSTAPPSISSMFRCARAAGFERTITPSSSTTTIPSSRSSRTARAPVVAIAGTLCRSRCPKTAYPQNSDWPESATAVIGYPGLGTPMMRRKLATMVTREPRASAIP